MDSRIELQPDKTIIVLGAEIIASLTKKSDAVPPVTFRSLKEMLLQNPTDLSENKMLQSRQLQGMFGGGDVRKMNSNSSLLDRLLELQRNGALLACLYPDVVVDQILEQQSLSSVHVDKWVDQCKGIMHLYGVCSDVESMQCLIKDQPILSDAILNVFKNKLCVCVGFSNDQDAQSDMQCFLSQLPVEEMQCILLPSESVSNTSQGLSVPVGNSHEALWSLCPIGDTSKAIGDMTMIEQGDSSGLGQPLSLLIASKNDYVKAAKLLSTLPGSGFIMLNSMEYSGLPFHVMTMHICQEKFQEFWCNLMQPSIMESLMNYTVLAIILNHSTFIWLGGGKSAKISTQQSLGELMCNSANSLPVTTRPLLSQTTQVTQLNPTAFDITSVLNKQHRTHPRYTIKKQKVESKLMNNNLMAQSSCILKRRMSLPYNPTLPNTTSVGCQQKNKSKNPNLQTSSRQQFLLSRYFLNRKNEQQNSPMKPKLNILRQLLQEERKEFTKPNPKSAKHLSDWVVERRRSLFVGDSQEWSCCIRKDLEKKKTKWHKIRDIRLRKQEEEARRQERARRTSLDSNSSSTSSDIIRPHFSATGIVNAGPLRSPLLTTVNPYILPHATNFALQASMMYQPSYLSSYPLVTTLPVPYPLLNASNLVLVSSGSLGSSTATVTATSTSKNPSTIQLSPPLSSVSLTNASRLSTGAGSKRKHSNPEKSYSEISSLLMKKNTDQYHPSPSKQLRMVASPASLSDEKSDGEESNSEHMSCDSSENEENHLPLWKFLLELLLSNSYSHLIDWNRIHSLEFQVKQPKEIAKLWSTYKADGSIDYNRYKKILQYYCTKDQPILNCVSGKEEMYRFSSSMLYYINNRYSQLQRSELSVMNSSNLEQSRELCGSQEVLVVD